jgi:hypothetical protein
MEGDDKTRHCSRCNQRVHNLTAMTTAEAEELLSSHGGRICVRYYRRADGRIMTKDCPKGVKRVRRQRAWAAGGLLAFLINLASGAGIFRSEQGDVDSSSIQGAIAAERPPEGETLGKPSLTSEMFDLDTPHNQLGDSASTRR